MNILRIIETEKKEDKNTFFFPFYLIFFLKMKYNLEILF